VPLLIVGAVMNVVIPTFFYPVAKITWVAIDMHVNSRP